MALPSKEERALLDTFRGNVADILTEEDAADDMFLVRWLRDPKNAIFVMDISARDLNMDKAKEMLRNAMKWRMENHLDDTINRSKVSNKFYEENFPLWIDGMDKEGRPVVTVLFGSWDVRKVVKDGKSHEFVTYLTENFEEVRKAIKESSQMHPPKHGEAPVTQVIAIFDWLNFAWGQVLSYQSVQNFLQIAAIYEAYYPEILYKCYFTNCSPIISTAIALLRPVIAQKTMEKITCFSTNSQEWSEEIKRLMNPNQLRRQFGGTKTDDHNPFHQ